jgi:hypothetical protein
MLVPSTNLLTIGGMHAIGPFIFINNRVVHNDS